VVGLLSLGDFVLVGRHGGKMGWAPGAATRALLACCCESGSCTEEWVIAEMRLASDSMWRVWQGQSMVGSSSLIARLHLCLQMRRERDATGAVRSSLRPGKARKHDPARASFLFQVRLTSYSTGITYSSQLTRPTTTPHQPPATPSLTACSSNAAVLYTSACASTYIDSSSLLQ
jgi:hypothetical protein